jgi:hypothetical protein
VIAAIGAVVAFVFFRGVHVQAPEAEAELASV